MFRWPPPKTPITLGVVIPSSNLSLHKDLRLKTRLAGEFARALAVFRVSALAIFRDPDATYDDHRLFLKVAEYMLIPPYLRVKVLGIDRDLRFAGLLPPLTIYPHNPEGRSVLVGDLRYGVVLNEYGLVDVGWKRPCRLLNAESGKPNELVLVNIVSTDPFVCVNEVEPRNYVGYKVVDLPDLRSLRKFLENYDLVINTSKTGKSVNRVFGDPETRSRIASAKSICLLFGNPRNDFDELTESSLKIDLAVNFIPYQGTLSVRTFEALISSLAILNALIISSECIVPEP